jgi:hypothetical protein
MTQTMIKLSGNKADEPPLRPRICDAEGCGRKPF